MFKNAQPEALVSFLWLLSVILMMLLIYYLINIGNNFVPEKKRIRFNNSKLLPIIGLVIVIYLLTRIFNTYTLISDTFYAVAFSIVLAYLFNPLVDYLENQGLKRLYGVLTIYIGILGIILILAFIVMPNSTQEIRSLFIKMPDYFSNITNFFDSIYKSYIATLGELPPILQGVDSIINENTHRIEIFLTDGIRTIVGGVVLFFTKIVSIVLTPVLTLYFLVDKDIFVKKIKEIIPQRYKEEILYLAREIDISVSQFVRGRILLAIFVGITTTIVLLILGIDFALVIGFITGVADIIPYIGPFLGFLPAVIFAFISSPVKAIWISIIFVLIQWVENNILAPKIIGHRTGMHPLTVLLSLIIGGSLFGVLGMIFSVPMIAVIKIFYVFFREKLRLRREN